ncbi:MAG: gliding motility-associated peptidyl-prolyl isomerase GldI [Flavicella sp.]
MKFRILIKVSLFLVVLFFTLVSCDSNEARKPIQRKGGASLKKSVDVNKVLFEKEQNAMRDFMRLDSLHIYQDSGKGFWYTLLQKSSAITKTPVKGDVIQFEQEILSLNGKVIYSKEELGIQTYVVDKEHVVKGVKEGVKLMRENEEFKFIFSSFVAFRMNGDEAQRVGVNEPIVSIIKLLKIN